MSLHTQIPQNQSKAESAPTQTPQSNETEMPQFGTQRTPAQILHLQRTIGNQAALRVLGKSAQGAVVQRLPLEKKTKQRVEAALERLNEDNVVAKKDIEDCMLWAEDVTHFSEFTESFENFSAFLSLRQTSPGTTASDLLRLTGDLVSGMVPEAKKLVRGIKEFKSQKFIVDEENSKQEKTSGEKTNATPKNIPKELSYGESKIVSDVRPPAGNTVPELAQINKKKWPATFAQTLINIGDYTINPPELLTHKQNTEGETVEIKVLLNSNQNRFFVVHYHPKVVLPKGALAGESEFHIKANRGIKSHEAITSDFLTNAGILTFAEVQQQRNEGTIN